MSALTESLKPGAHGKGAPGDLASQDAKSPSPGRTFFTHECPTRLEGNLEEKFDVTQGSRARCYLLRLI